MTEPSWTLFFECVAIGLLGFYFGLTTRLGVRSENPTLYVFRRMTRNTGLIIGIGVSMVALTILIELMTGP